MKSRAFATPGYNPATRQWNDSLAGDYLWSNVNVAEAVPYVMTPSTWSLWSIFHVETNPFQFPGEHPICGNICGRPYLNISLMYSVYRLMGRDARKELEGGMTASLPIDIPAVVGCGNATMLLRTGARVRVDGGAGTVEILSQPEASL